MNNLKAVANYPCTVHGIQLRKNKQNKVALSKVPKQIPRLRNMRSHSKHVYPGNILGVTLWPATSQKRLGLLQVYTPGITPIVNLQ